MNISEYFKAAIDKKASDLHLIEGSAPVIRVSGELIKLNEDMIPFGELKYAIFNSMEANAIEKFKEKKDLDFSMEFFNNRFRINLHYQEGRVGLSARLIPNTIPTPKEVGFDEVMNSFTHLKDGLVLVTGPTGSGKSTTLAVMIDLINTERRSHIITIEDPIEFNFNDKKSIIEQRQIGRDTDSFASALMYTLRQDPNVIMVGELRDIETVRGALTAARTGQLVISTLHTATAPEAIERLIDFFPINEQGQVAHQIASILRAVIAQQLVPAKKGGTIMVREIMINNVAISNLIRTGKYEQLNGIIQTGQKDGMISMNKSMEGLFHEGLITQEVLDSRKRNADTQTSSY